MYNGKDEFPFSAFLGLSRPFSAFLGLSRPFSAFLGLVLLTGFMACPNSAVGQRPDRSDLNAMDAVQQEQLAQLILDWITEPMNTEHGTTGFTDIHNTNNFFPWHRSHIREIEDYINTVQPSLLPNGLLPYYNPYYTMPDAFHDLMDDFVPTQLDPDMEQYPDLSDDFMNQICLPAYQDIGAFSDALENGYHADGHVAMGGLVLDNKYSAASAIFWPWHAWIDEFWYRWERDCAGGYTDFDLSDNKIEITGTATWFAEHWVKGIIEIKNGGSLTIKNGAVIHFAPSDYNARKTKIIVKPGGKLVVDNSRLTGISILGNGGADGTDPSGIHGVKYHTGWEGILVEGNKQIGYGQVVLRNDAIVEHATIAVESTNGGRVHAVGASLLNNRFDIVIGAFPGIHECHIVGVDMINNAPLRDVVWVSAPVAGLEREHHVNHEDTHSTDTHVSLGGAAGGVHGHVLVNSCLIDNPFQDPHGHYVSVGVRGLDSKYIVEQCEIGNQVTGVEGANFTPGPGRDALIRNNFFSNNRQSINLVGVDYSNVDGGNVFEIPKAALSGVTPYDPLGLYAQGSVSMTVKDNVFKTLSNQVSTKNYGAIISNSSPSALMPFASRVEGNTFTGVGISAQAQKANADLQFRCNSFAQFQTGIAVTTGVLPNQGSCGSGSSPAGNTWDNLNTCAGPPNESQIYKEAGIPVFKYFAHSNLLPFCVSPGVLLNNCLTPSTALSCGEEPPPCDPGPCPPVEFLIGLENAKTGASPEQVASLTFQQKTIFTEALNGLLDGDAGAVDSALWYIGLVEQVSPSIAYVGDKAALMLQKSEPQNIVPGTLALISNLPTADPNKIWLNLKHDLLASGRSFAELTPAELTFVEAEAVPFTKSGAHGKAILKAVTGQPIPTIIDPIITERQSPKPLPRPVSTAMEVSPNPTPDRTTIRFDAFGQDGQAQINLFDLNGRLVQSLDVAGFPEAILDTSRLPAGVYQLQLRRDGLVVDAQKLIVIR